MIDIQIIISGHWLLLKKAYCSLFGICFCTTISSNYRIKNIYVEWDVSVSGTTHRSVHRFFIVFDLLHVGTAVCVCVYRIYDRYKLEKHRMGFAASG